ncbi:hypothetical protein DV736_g3051, partial [Chaetothyriales sp. CBS 134916]
MTSDNSNKSGSNWPSLNQAYTEPSPTAPNNYQREIYGALRKPLFPTKPALWEAIAWDAVPTANFNYVAGAASSGATHRANLDAFDRYRLRPRMLVNTTVRDLSVELFGRRYTTPLLIGPVGVQSIMHGDGEVATARASRAVGVPMVLSTASSKDLEEVARANGDGGERWFQLYWPRPQAEEVTASLLARAKAAGFTALVVTLDTFMLGWRPADLDESYLPFIWGQGCAIGLSDPVFNRMWEEKVAEDKRSLAERAGELLNVLRRPGSPWGALKVLMNLKTMQRSMAWMDILNSSTYREWGHLAILKKLWDGPIVLKGIQRVEDAHRAIEAGIDGIIVSNHGGRQTDGAIASLDALAEIGTDAKVRESGITVLFDSGIRTGADVLKAIALGAKAVLIGRPLMYGLAMGGQAGVEHVLRCLLADTDNTMGNLGVQRLSDLSRDDLRVRSEARL